MHYKHLKYNAYNTNLFSSSNVSNVVYLLVIFPTNGLVRSCTAGLDAKSRPTLKLCACSSSSACFFSSPGDTVTVVQFKGMISDAGLTVSTVVTQIKQNTIQVPVFDIWKVHYQL